MAVIGVQISETAQKVSARDLFFSRVNLILAYGVYVGPDDDPDEDVVVAVCICHIVPIHAHSHVSAVGQMMR